MNMASITTLNQIISWFRDYSAQHPTLNDFGYGATDAIGTTREMRYPYLWASSTNSNPINISNHVVQPEFEFLIMCVDAISDQAQPAVENGWAATNEQDVLSDTYQILQDFIAWLNSSWRATGITISTALTAQPVYDTTPDRVSGWAVTVSLKIPYSLCVSGIDVNLPNISSNLTAQNAVSASYASYALTASYALNGGGGNIDTSSFITAAQTASMTVLSASYATTASYALNAGTTIDTGSFVTTSSFNSFTSSYYIASASFDTRIASASAKTLFPEIELGTATSQSGNWRLQPSSSALAFQYWDALNTTWVTDTLMTGTPMSGSGGAVASASFASTSSWSAYSVTSSYSEYAVSASNALTASYSETSSYAFTSSYSVSASYSETASYALTASYIESSSYSLTSSFAVTSISASNALSAVTASHLLGTASNAVSASYSVSASWAPYQTSASFATTASYIDPAFISASAAASGFGTGGAASAFPYTGSAGISGSLLINGSLIVGSPLNLVQNDFAVAQGIETAAFASGSHAEGIETSVSQFAIGAHAEGYQTYVGDRGRHAHAEGSSTFAFAYAAHTEGEYSTANGYASHAEGYFTQTTGTGSHAEGSGSGALAAYSHAEGNNTKAVSEYQHTQGVFNLPVSGAGAFIHGNGTSNSSRSNLIVAQGNTVQITGSIEVSGSLSVNGTQLNADPIIYNRLPNGDFALTHSLQGWITVSGPPIFSVVAPNVKAIGATGNSFSFSNTLISASLPGLVWAPAAAFTGITKVTYLNLPALQTASGNMFTLASTAASGSIIVNSAVTASAGWSGSASTLNQRAWTITYVNG